MADDSIMHIEVDGTKYSLDLAEFTPRDARDFRAVTDGSRLIDAVYEPDLDHIAAFVWLHRRRLERNLTFAQVEDGFTLGSVLEDGPVLVKGETGAEDPEA